MNGAFKARSDAVCFTPDINAGAADPGSVSPGKTSIMLIILIAIAVTFSLVGELFYSCLANRRQLGWVRPDINEHAAIMRQLGRMRSNRFEF
ncbi:hypothetical protein FHX08_001617 [Rhizobium sp. BK529]|uniref:hypothetical protein n=1 Tax=unclassified Rhizobium TaxID=2613769 RepID=UPI00104E9349|nr:MULTISPECIES: hypothetical protein [unclassified Rhizobium]MBB3591273.1 hypothetical protein [Rhizobium sp. BK529]TCS08775.1 hypothetical protein EV281_101651 [Rhizobium sp. BK418]